MSGAVALMVAGCSGDAADDGTTGPLVSVADVDGTTVLVDADGRTLYSADVEDGGQIKCVDACTSFWEPVSASAAEVDEMSKDLDDLGVVDRPDGETQLTYDDLPLYTFTEEGAGELTGDGFTDDFQGTHFVWSAARTDESPSSEPADSGGGFGY